MRTVFGNPLIERYGFSLFRPVTFWIQTSIYLITTTLLLAWNCAAFKYSTVFENVDGFLRSVYYQLMGIEAIVLLIWSGYNSGVAIRDEFAEKSYDFFRMIPLSANQKALGILIGRNLVALILAGVNALLMFGFGVLGGVSLNLQGEILLLIISMTFFGDCLSLLVSSYSARKGRRSDAGAMVLLWILVSPYVIAGLSDAGVPTEAKIQFFCLKIPVFLMVAFVTMFFGGWVYAGVLRRFTKEKAPLFSERGLIVFMLSLDLLILGFHWPYLTGTEGTVNNYFFWLAIFVPLFFIPMGAFKTFDDYLELTGQANGVQKKTSHTSGFLLHISNLSLQIRLFVMWALLALGSSILAGASLLQGFYYILTLFTFWLFLMLLMETYITYSTQSGKVGILVAFIILLYLLLPLVMWTLLDVPRLRMFSLIGFWSEIFDCRPVNDRIWMANLLLCIVPAMLVANKYRFIRQMREIM